MNFMIEQKPVNEQVLNLLIGKNLKWVRIGIFVLICFNTTSAQNLIQDSSFEFNRYTPVNFSEINASYYWDKPSAGTSDLFCKCGKKQKKYSLVDVPSNLMGNQIPHFGTCYAGFFAFSHGAYREYLQTNLKTPLEKNKNYRFKMYISLADYSRTSVDQLGVCFLSHKVGYESSNVIEDLNPIYLKIQDEDRNDTINWHCLTFLYRAIGGETHLLIGSFDVNEIKKTNVKAPKEVKTRINQITERDSYYYIDDVSVVETIDNSLITQSEIFVNTKTESQDRMPLNTPLILENVLFKTNEAILSAFSYTELDKVVDYLKSNEQISIEIIGHTDSLGNENKNKILSTNRAIAVQDYLISKNIDNKRITYLGCGGTRPIATNKTEDGRRRNRRVEFVLKD